MPKITSIFSPDFITNTQAKHLNPKILKLYAMYCFQIKTSGINLDLPTITSLSTVNNRETQIGITNLAYC